MLKANELMAGDIICQEFSNLVLVVSAVMPPYVQCVGEEGQFHEKTIKPIPLMPEILEKNGFILKEEEKGVYGVDIAPYYTRDDVPFEVFCDGEPFAIWFKDPVNIKYVHQLQNAMRLCGIEKEIVL
jgi:hypothetical protein